jgi:methionyl-tRNA synthetase
MNSQQDKVNFCGSECISQAVETRTKIANKVNKRYTVTTALPYANGPVHIGHLAGVYVPADIYVRYLRMQGRNVVFIGGSDEHGVPVTIKARKEGITPQQLVDRYHNIIKKSFENFGISFDIYSRTSNEHHHKNASEFFKTLYDKGCFVEKTSLQFYDEDNKQFLADRYIVGECPHCHAEDAYGDQCEKCGSSLSPEELINPRSSISGNAPIMKETKHWYLPLNDYESFLREWILDGHKNDWKTNVYGQCKSWIDQGLLPRAVTRDLDWGVKVPLPQADGKVLYVWFDAPIGYISATQELFENPETAAKFQTDGEQATWEEYWKSEDTKLVHFIGKDNIVFHCIVFPAMLKAEGSYIMPDNVPANEFLNLEGDKISTSRNWAVWLHEYLEDFSNKEDVLRYVLTANAPETKDNDFTWKDFQARNNNELVAIFGNFVNRIMVLTHKYFEGKVPTAHNLQEIDKNVLQEMLQYPDKISASIEQYRFREALSELMNLARLGNKYLTDTEPWKLYKTDIDRTATVLNVSLQIVAHLAVLCEPFLPFTAKKMRLMLGLSEHFMWSDTSREILINEGTALKEPAFLFEKIEDDAIQKQIDKLKNDRE